MKSLAAHSLTGVTLNRCMILLSAAALTVTSGCATTGKDKTYTEAFDRSRLQVQFYSPPGARVQMRTAGMGTQTVGYYEQQHRLEAGDQGYARFNLEASPAPYEFAYSTSEGAGFTAYGELVIHPPTTERGLAFMSHTIVPIALPSEAGTDAGDDYFPARGPSGAGLTGLELSHLKQGDLIEKVYFVADLQQAWESVREIDSHVDRLRSAEIVLNSQLEFVDSRYQDYRRETLYSDPTEDPLAANRDSGKRSMHYVELEASRQMLENARFDIRRQIDDLTEERRIRTRLLDSMRIVNRRGALVLATPETQWPYHDPVTQITSSRVFPNVVTGPDKNYSTGELAVPPLGEVLLTMRLGGRHMEWSADRPMGGTTIETMSMISQ